MLTFQLRLRRSIRPPARRIPRGALLAGVALLASGGCSGTPSAAERAARSDVREVAERYRPDDAKPDLPALDAASPLDQFLRYALLNSPRVEAAYFGWVAAVEAITPARSLPDPRLTFESDIADSVMTLMPGLMVDLPGPGKLRAAGDAAAAASRAAYWGFEREMLETALAIKTAYYRLNFLEESIRVERQTLGLLEDLELLARQQNAAGRVTLQDVLRAQIARDRLEIQIANLEDSRGALAAEWKSALGLGPTDADPPIPAAFEPSAGEPLPDEILETALQRNPRLRALAEDVRRAGAELELARKSGVPDFTLGLESDLKADPVMLRPMAAMSLPVWRDRIAARIAGARAQERSAQALLGAEELRIAAELAAMLFMYRESVRDDALLRGKLVPKARQSLEAARAGYVNGRAGFLDVIDAQRTLLEFELSGIEARTQRELALANLSLSIAGVPPPGAPTLDGGAGSATDEPAPLKDPQESRP